MTIEFRNEIGATVFIVWFARVRSGKLNVNIYDPTGKASNSFEIDRPDDMAQDDASLAFVEAHKRWRATL